MSKNASPDDDLISEREAAELHASITREIVDNIDYLVSYVVIPVTLNE
jgi:hypothetical protein